MAYSNPTAATNRASTPPVTVGDSGLGKAGMPAAKAATEGGAMAKLTGMLSQGYEGAKDLGSKAWDGAKDLGGKAVDYSKANPGKAIAFGAGAAGTAALLAYILRKRKAEPKRRRSMYA